MRPPGPVPATPLEVHALDGGGAAGDRGGLRAVGCGGGRGGGGGAEAEAEGLGRRRAAAPALVVMRARTWPTVTVSPACARTSVIVPVAGEGTSASTLSVEISTTVSSAATASPGCLCHSRIVPSVTDSPIAGMTISSVAAAPSVGGGAQRQAPQAERPAAVAGAGAQTRRWG